jgi:predicted DNA-binding transcriptional regulator YafY
MDRTERFYKIDQLLHERRIVPYAALAEGLGVSRATIKRDLEYLRNRLNAPIVWDRDAGGYRYDRPARHGPKFELPGLWFSAAEIHALLTMQQLLANLDGGGLLGPHIRPLLARLTALLGSQDAVEDEVRRRIRILGMAARQTPVEHFAVVGTALVKRKRLRISHHVRSRDEIVDREVSPQRLVHYRDNWYLDAWCHMRNGLRSFAVDAIREARLLDTRAQDVPKAELDKHLGSGYGIFAGASVEWAKLRFSPQAARWVSAQNWHPDQRVRVESDGSYVMEIPYAADRELVMEILKFGADVGVLEPDALRLQVSEALKQAARKYD